MPWKKYQSIEVVESQDEVPCRHPRYGYDKLIVLKDASLLLLVDETLLVVCDDCGFNGLTGSEPYVKPEGEYKSILKQADSLLAHKAGTHWAKAPRGPLYADDQIEVAIAIWYKWKATGDKRWTERACEEMELRGFLPYRGAKWNPDSLRRLVHRYEEDPRFGKVKLAVMSNIDKAAGANVAKMVREALVTNGKDTSVAAKARITEKNKHTPVDFNRTISEKKAGLTAQREEAQVPGGDSSTPTLSFVGRGEDVPEPAPAMVIKVDSVPSPAPTAPSSPDYNHVMELVDGSPLFTYRGETLMVGKPVKGVEI